MIIRLTDPAEAYQRYSPFAWWASTVKTHRWKHLLHPLLDTMKGTRCFIVLEPAYLDVCREPVDERPKAFISISEPAARSPLAEEILHAWCLRQRDRTRESRPGVLSGGFLTDDPETHVKIWELDPRTWLELLFTTFLAGSPAEALHVTVRDMPGRAPKGIVPEMVYYPRTGTLALEDENQDEVRKRFLEILHAADDIIHKSR